MVPSFEDIVQLEDDNCILPFVDSLHLIYNPRTVGSMALSHHLTSHLVGRTPRVTYVFTSNCSVFISIERSQGQKISKIFQFHKFNGKTSSKINLFSTVRYYSNV